MGTSCPFVGLKSETENSFVDFYGICYEISELKSVDKTSFWWILQHHLFALFVRYFSKAHRLHGRCFIWVWDFVSNNKGRTEGICNQGGWNHSATVKI